MARAKVVLRGRLTVNLNNRVPAIGTVLIWCVQMIAGGLEWEMQMNS
jgi:hypothetical protein